MEFPSHLSSIITEFYGPHNRTSCLTYSTNNHEPIKAQDSLGPSDLKNAEDDLPLLVEPQANDLFYTIQDVKIHCPVIQQAVQVRYSDDWGRKQ
ncbi:hypothetical protein D915_002447 [Fasciola hepatica]|uniref:Uncharacterized protein n=1 Tax=Fasciola hepatica TaxID=6192 RepID=A0A4E0S1T8_FASHE|nr:hypothetical protein D915_002447 [Fasciola hepatica]